MAKSDPERIEAARLALSMVRDRVAAGQDSLTFYRVPCLLCCYWAPHEGQQADSLDAFGECRRVAPSDVGDSEFPLTRARDWCGEADPRRTFDLLGDTP